MKLSENERSQKLFKDCLLLFSDNCSISTRLTAVLHLVYVLPAIRQYSNAFKGQFRILKLISLLKNTNVCYYETIMSTLI